MPERKSFDYAIIRVVPQVEREEFLNVGVIVSCPEAKFLAARVELDRPRLAVFAPQLDPDVVEGYLQAIPLICQGGAEGGPIGQLPLRARFDWLTAPRSTIVQTSAAHTGLCADPESILEHLLATMVRPPVSENETLTKEASWPKNPDESKS